MADNSTVQVPRDDLASWVETLQDAQKDTIMARKDEAISWVRNEVRRHLDS